LSWEDLENELPPHEPNQAGVDLNLQMAKAFASDEAFREGQNSVIRDIENRIRKAKNQ